MLSTSTVPESMSTSTGAVSSPSPTTAAGQGDTDAKWWQNSSHQTEPGSHYVLSTGSTSQPIPTSWSLSSQPNEGNVPNSHPGPISEGDFFTTTVSGSDLPSSGKPVTWQVTPFYNTLTKEPGIEIHSGSGEDSEQSEIKNENNSVTWTEIRVAGKDASVVRSTEIPLGPPPTPYLRGASLWPPFSTVMEDLLPSHRPATLKNGTPGAEVITEKPANTPFPLGGDHQPAPTEHSVRHNPPELPGSVNLMQGSGPVLTKEDATSLIAEGFLLNASDYKELSTGGSPAYWIAGNWSEVGVPFLTPCPTL